MFDSFFPSSNPSSGGGSFEPQVYSFTNIDGATGVTITHNSGYKPATVVTGTLASTGIEDSESFGALNHTSVNEFVLTWLGGLASGSVTYF